MKNWEKEDKNVTNLWNKMEYFDPQPIIWVSKNSLFSMFKILKNVLKSGYLFAWGIEKQHKKVEMWYKIEYFHSQPIIRYPHSKKVFWKSTKFWLILSRFTKNCQNQQKLLSQPYDFEVSGTGAAYDKSVLPMSIRAYPKHWKGMVPQRVRESWRGA